LFYQKSLLIFVAGKNKKGFSEKQRRKIGSGSRGEPKARGRRIADQIRARSPLGERVGGINKSKKRGGKGEVE